MSRRKKRTRRTNISHTLTKHRFPEFRNSKWNQVRVDAVKHDAYHRLFGHMTPEEAFGFLVETFWQGFVEPVEVYFKAPERVT